MDTRTLNKNLKMKHKIRHIVSKRPKLPFKRRKDVGTRFDEAVKELPRITNDTVAAHREEVLSGARKYIYPLQHSKHIVVIVSSTLFISVLTFFFIYCGLALYRFQTNSVFLYGVTKVIPFPVAKVGSSYISYENYLFELRHRIHYYQTQQQVDFNSTSGKQQLVSFKHQAMQTVVDYALVKQIASKNKVSVSDQDINNEIALVKSEDKLGSNEKEFETVLNEFWGWSLNDFKRELKQQLLSQKVVSKLDTKTHAKAVEALNALQSGSSFSSVAAKYSDDITTKNNGGQFSFTITKDNQNITPQTLEELLKLKPGQTSNIIDLGNALEIDQVISNTDGQIQAAHIVFNFQDISVYIKQIQSKEKNRYFIKLPTS